MDLRDRSHLLPYARRSILKVARATRTFGKMSSFYRFLNHQALLRGVLSLVLPRPVSAVFSCLCIAFAIYWVLKTIFLSYHVRYNWSD